MPGQHAEELSRGRARNHAGTPGQREEQLSRGRPPSTGRPPAPGALKRHRPGRAARAARPAR